MRKYSENADSYTDPETEVLKNKLGITTEKDLEKAEVAAASLRSEEIARNPIAGKFDLHHLKAIHQKLFGDVYQWAGQIRTVDIFKGKTYFAHHSQIESSVQKITEQLNRENNLRGLSADKFSERAGHYMTELNVAHPFREGNGRVLREYMGQLAKQAGYEIKWEGIARKDMTQASIEGYQRSSKHMAGLIRENLVDRDRQLALYTARETIGKNTVVIEAQSGSSYTGKILAVTERHVAQINEKTGELVLHESRTLSGMQHVHENKTVEISYPAGRAGIVREPQPREHEKGREAIHERGYSTSERER